MKIHHGWVRDQGGVIRRKVLLSWGNTDHEIRAALARGDLVTVRHGWYAVPSADPQVVTAVAAGGALSCVAALRRRGVWTTDERPHVRVGEQAGPLPRTCCRCRIEKVRQVPHVAVDAVPTALLAAASCCAPEELLILLDSVVNLRLMEAEEVVTLLQDQPRRVRRVVARIDRAESGTETMVRDRLRRRGLQVQPQVVIPGVGRVDMLVGKRLVVEVDSVAHHTSMAAYTEDRRRDRRLRALGYEVVRLTYHHVVDEWVEAEADIVAIHRRLRRRAPLSTPSSPGMGNAA